MATKPTKVTDWATDGAALTAATDTTKHDLGWQTIPGNLPGQVGERPNLEMQNYWQLAVHEWVEYFQLQDDELQDNIDTVQDNLDTTQRPNAQIRYITPITHSDVESSNVDTGADTFTYVGHGFESGDRVVFSSGTLPTPLATATNYYVFKVDDDTFQLRTFANKYSGPAIDLTTQGSGNFAMNTNGSFYIHATESHEFFFVHSDSSLPPPIIILPEMSDFSVDDNGRVYNIVRISGSNVTIETASNETTIGQTTLLQLNLSAKGDVARIQVDRTVLGTDQGGKDYYNWNLLNYTTVSSGFTREITDYFSNFTATTEVNVAGNNFSGGNEGMQTGDKVQISTSGSLPAPLLVVTNYYVIKLARGLIQLAATLSDAKNHIPIDLTTQGTGTHTIISQSDWVLDGSQGYANFLIDTDSATHSVELTNWSENQVRITKQGANGQINISGDRTINGESSISLFSDVATANITTANHLAQTGWYSDLEEARVDVVDSGSDDINGDLFLARRQGLVNMRWSQLSHDNVGAPLSSVEIPSRFRPPQAQNNLFNCPGGVIEEMQALTDGTFRLSYYNSSLLSTNAFGCGPGSMSWFQAPI